MSTDLHVTINSDEKSQIVHLIYPQDLSSINKNIIVDFGAVKITPGEINITIHNSEIENSEPIASFGEFDQLPLSIPTNSHIARVVYSGKIKSLEVTYRLVDSTTSCQFLSTFTPTFEIRGGQVLCSWYIPQVANKGFMINPTIVKIPKGKVLTVNVFSKDKPLQTKLFAGKFFDFQILILQ